MRPSAHRDDTHYARHLRRRCQRAEAEVRALQERLDALEAERDGERRDLLDYLDGPRHAHDVALSFQSLGRDAVRDMSTRHKSCGSCGGYRREMWDAMLAPALSELRAKIRDGLAVPDGEPAPPWPVAPGASYFKQDILAPFRTPDEQEAQDRFRREQARHHARVDRGDLSGW